MTEFTITSFVCFVQAAGYVVVHLFMPAYLRTSTKGDLLCANKNAFVPLLRKMRVDVHKRDLLRLISDCTVDPVSAILAFTRVGKIDWAAPDCVGRFLYDSKVVAIFSVPERQTKNLKRVLRVDSLLGVVYVKVARYMKEFSNAGMSGEIFKAVWGRYHADGIDLKGIRLLAEQQAIEQNLDNEFTSVVFKGTDDEEDN